MDDSAKINDLEPDFAGKIRAFKLLLLEQTGWEWVVVQGRRTIAEQNSLYAQGRTAPGNIVTNAQGGSSAHNFGLAVDMVPIKDNTLWWDAPDSLFKQYADLAQQQGLVAGYYFHSIHDPDHIEDGSWRVVQAKWRAGDVQIA